MVNNTTTEPDVERLKKYYDNEIQRLRHIVQAKEDGLIHWRRAYDEIDAKETEAWKQVNQLKQLCTGLMGRLYRQMRHVGLLTKQIKAAKAKRDQKIATLEQQIYVNSEVYKAKEKYLLEQYEHCYKALCELKFLAAYMAKELDNRTESGQ